MRVGRDETGRSRWDTSRVTQNEAGGKSKEAGSNKDECGSSDGTRGRKKDKERLTVCLFISKLPTLDKAVLTTAHTSVNISGAEQNC